MTPVLNKVRPTDPTAVYSSCPCAAYLGEVVKSLRLSKRADTFAQPGLYAVYATVAGSLFSPPRSY
jgi:hypothetical protein